MEDSTHSLMICGCRSSCRYWISRSILPAMSRVTSLFRFMIFRATFWPLTWCVASFTFPKEPSPSVLTIVYCPRRWLALESRALLGSTAGTGRTGSVFWNSTVLVVLAPPRRGCDTLMESSSRSSFSIAADMAGGDVDGSDNRRQQDSVVRALESVVCALGLGWYVGQDPACTLHRGVCAASCR